MARVNSKNKGTPPETPELDPRQRLITAYILWLLLGVLGAHRFYLGRKNSGLLMGFAGPMFLSLGLFFNLLPGLGVSPFLVMSPFILWWVVDGVSIPRWLSPS